MRHPSLALTSIILKISPLENFDIPLNRKCLHLVLHVSGHRLKRIEDQRDFRRYIYFICSSPDISHSTDAAQESYNVELEVGKRVDTLAFVWEQGESFLIGEGRDGWPGY